MGVLEMAWGVLACAAGGTAAGLALRAHRARLDRANRRVAAYGEEVAGARRAFSPGTHREWGLRYCELLSRRLLTDATDPISPSVRSGRADKTRAGIRFMEQSLEAGCSKEVTVSAFCEARLRLALLGAAIGAGFGALFSIGFALLLGVAGILFGGSVPMRSVRAARHERAVSAERHLSEMLEVVSLGLRSGLTFDRSFALYGSHFDNDFAQSCAKAYRCWSLGLMTREEALVNLAASYDCEQLARIVGNIVRGLRFGSALAGTLEEAASQSRATYRTSLAERVAKAPVKMMLPTGTLILPAMLLLVMGPVLLEVAGGF